MWRRWLVLASVLVVAIAAIGGVSLAILQPSWFQPRPARDLVITTATQGGTFIVLGERLARILSEYSGKAIGKVEAKSSAGSAENVERLADRDADIAFVSEAVLVGHPRKEDVRVLATLYTDVLQIVVRKSASIERLSDLMGKRVSIGTEGGASELLSPKIWKAANLTNLDYSRVKISSFQNAVEKLQANEMDAAFFLAATPDRAVAEALASGCCVLLHLAEHVDSIARAVPKLTASEISPHVYRNQPDPIRTVGSSALLVAHKDLRNDVVMEVLGSLFDNLGELARAHVRAQDIRMNVACAGRREDLAAGQPGGVGLHPGAIKFRARLRDTLVIATGTIRGKYSEIGTSLRNVLRQRGFPARVVHTNGSLENLELLKANDCPTLAIVQYDTALASLWGTDPYQSDAAVDVADVDGLRRIALVHDQKVHVVMRRDRLPANMRVRPTLAALDGARVVVGPKNSGTQFTARAILRLQGVVPREELYLSVPDMVQRLHEGEVDAGFFISHVPSEALQTVIQDDAFRLLPIDTKKVGGLKPALRPAKIEPGTYGAQHDDEPAIETAATWAVLVTRKDLPFDVRGITEAVFDGAGFLGVEGGIDTMKQRLASLPLHPQAMKYYQRMGWEPDPDPPFVKRIGDWLKSSWYVLAMSVILAAGYRGVLKLRRDGTSNGIGRHILAISIEERGPDTVRKLRKIRAEIRARVRLRWWRAGELDKPRWRYLYDLINERIEQAREYQTRYFAEEIRAVLEDRGLEDGARGDRLRAFEQQAWQCFESAELNAAQLNLLLEMIRDDNGRAEGPENSAMESVGE